MSIIYYIFLFLTLLTTVFSGTENKNEAQLNKLDNQTTTFKSKALLKDRTVSSKTIVEVFKTDVDLDKCVIMRNDQFMKLMSECHQQYSAESPKFSRVAYEIVSTYFCMAYYDLALKICHIHKTLDTDRKLSVEDYFKNNTMNITALSKKYKTKICTNFADIFYTNVTFPQTEKWSLQKYLNRENCKLLCIDNENINENCLYIYDLLTFIKTISTTIVYTQTKNASVEHVQTTPSKPIGLSNKNEHSGVTNLHSTSSSEIMVKVALTENAKSEKYLESLSSDILSTNLPNSEKTEISKLQIDQKKYTSTSTTKFTNSQYPDQMVYNGNTNDYSDNEADMDSFIQPGEANLPLVNMNGGVTGGSKQLPEIGSDESYVPYFLLLSVSCVIGYFIIINKHKILALAVEGRPNRLHRRRPNTANYRKLDSNLEEAVTSTCSNSVSHVIY